MAENLSPDGWIDCDLCGMNYEGSKCPCRKETAAELETIVIRTRALLVEQEKAWHDALVRECGFPIESEVVIKATGITGQVRYWYLYAGELWLGVVAKSGYSYDCYPRDLQRIDQDGNLIGER